MNLDSLRHYLRGRLFELLRRRDAALDEYIAALRADPRSTRLNHVVACMLSERKRYAEAEPYFREALNHAPTNANIWFNYGFAHDQNREPEKAIEAFRETVRLNPNIDRAWYGLGLCHANLGDHAEAAKALQRAAELQPMNGIAWFHLGMAYHASGQAEKVADVAKHLNRFDRKLTRQLIRDTQRTDLQKLVADMREF